MRKELLAVISAAALLTATSVAFGQGGGAGGAGGQGGPTPQEAGRSPSAATPGGANQPTAAKPKAKMSKSAKAKAKSGPKSPSPVNR